MIELPKEWGIHLIDFSSMAPRSDKMAESDYFLSLLRAETARDRFRWLLAAFLNAAYSYFETAALRAYAATTDEDGSPVADDDALSIIGQYVRVQPGSSKNPYFLKTSGLHPLVCDLYEIRKKCVHYFPIDVMIVGERLPEGFHIGNKRGSGRPAIVFCSEVMALIQGLEQELSI